MAWNEEKGGKQEKVLHNVERVDRKQKKEMGWNNNKQQFNAIDRKVTKVHVKCGCGIKVCWGKEKYKQNIQIKCQ